MVTLTFGLARRGGYHPPEKIRPISRAIDNRPYPLPLALSVGADIIRRIKNDCSAITVTKLESKLHLICVYISLLLCYDYAYYISPFLMDKEIF